MVFTKTIRIREKVFSRDDIIALWAFVSQQSKTQCAGEASISIKNKDQDVSSSSDDIFSTNNFIKKPIESIRIYYRSKDWTSKIEVTIAAEASYLFARSEAVVTGGAEEWVDACSERLRDILNDVKGTPWVTPIVRKGGMLVLAAAFIWVCWYVFMSSIVPLIKSITDILWLRFGFAGGYFVCVGWLYWRVMKLDELFPVVDIDIGGARHSARQRMAKMVWALLSSIVIPVAIGLWLNRFNNVRDQNETSALSGTDITNTVKGVNGVQ